MSNYLLLISRSRVTYKVLKYLAERKNRLSFSPYKLADAIGEDKGAVYACTRQLCNAGILDRVDSEVIKYKVAPGFPRTELVVLASLRPPRRVRQ